MSVLKPTAGGKIQATPLAMLLVYGLDRRLSGTLVLEDPTKGRSAILLERGAPVKAKTSVAVHHLGSTLVDLGTLDRAANEATVALALQQGKLHGQVLLAAGKISESQLRAGLQEQLLRKLAWMCALPPETVYGFYQKTDYLRQWGAEGAAVDSLAAIWRGVSTCPTSQHAEEVLKRLPPGPLRLHSQAQVGRFQLESAERALVEVLQAKPQTLADLIQTELLSADLTERLVYALAITRQLEVGTPSLPPAGAPDGERPRARASRVPRVSVEPGAARLSSAPGHAGSGDSAEARKHQLAAEAERIAGQNYYEILGVDQKASGSIIQGAFFQLAKKWHPDRIGPGLESIRALAAKTFTRISEAAAVLGEPERRAEYDVLLADGGGTAAEQEQLAAVLKAARAFQRAEILLKKGQLEEARKEAKNAYENDDEQAEYAALYAWIQAQTRERSGVARHEDLLALLDGAVEKEPDNLRIRYYRGQLLKRAGRMPVAIKDFVHITKLDPNHVDALREIRLYQMRKGDDLGVLERRKESLMPASNRESKDPGFFGRFFKR